MPQGDADMIREHATGLVEQARREGRERITIRSGDVHDALKLKQAHSNVGQALDGAKFHKQAHVELVDYHGVDSRRGSNSEFVFSILPLGTRSPGIQFSGTRPSDTRISNTRPSGTRRRITRAEITRSLGILPPSIWRKQVLELPIEEFQELFSDYLKAKGFSDADVEIVIRMKGQQG